MKIRLTKAKEDKLGTLTCLRDDGSVTWQPSSPYFARHDLIHYAVETTLGYREGFLGLVAAGKGLDEFGTRNGVKDTYTLEEAWAESIVGVLQWPTIGGGPEPSPAEFAAALQEGCEAHGMPAPEVSPAQLERIRMHVRALHRAWDRLPPGATMELTFPAAPAVTASAGSPPT